MTKPDFALAYSECTDTELQTFIQARGLHIAWTTRRNVISSLRAADHNATFRFLDLPPELRNVLYIDTLTLHKKDGKTLKKYCQGAAILSTCKQIYNEAKDVLYADSEITITLQVYQNVSFRHPIYQRTGVDAYVNGRIVHLLDKTLD